MRGFRICVYLLLVVPLLDIVGCGGPAYVMKGPEVETNLVTVSNCKAVPDTALVSKEDTLTWIKDQNDPHTYSIKFRKRKPVSLDTVPTGQGQKVNGDFACNWGGWADKNWCLYAYDLIQDGVTRCKDPGVHVH